MVLHFCWLAAMIVAVYAIYEDQIGKFDWLDSQIIGCLQEFIFRLLFSFICLVNKHYFAGLESFSK